MQRTRLILLSGFLGAGKTTLMLTAAERLREQGLRVACVTNDQGSDLIDSKMVLLKQLPLEQIQGGCFCCRFEDLVESIHRIVANEQPDIIIAEAVGSCTDLVATVVKPLRQLDETVLDIRPLTVVVDPRRLNDHLAGHSGVLTSEIAYVYQKQLEEAQYIVLNKTDLLAFDEQQYLQTELVSRFASEAVLALSAHDPNQVDDWLQYALNGSIEKLPNIKIDYDIYARGEAQLGWLNARVTFAGLIPSAREFTLDFAELLTSRLANQQMEIAHIKLWTQDKNESLKLSVINDSGLSLDHTTSADWPASNLLMLVNARVNGSDSVLRECVTTTLSLHAGRYGINADVEWMECFAPAYPTPLHRLA